MADLLRSSSKLTGVEMEDRTKSDSEVGQKFHKNMFSSNFQVEPKFLALFK